MKLFLASSLDKTISFLAPHLAEKAKVIFIANASDMYKEAWWVDNDREGFKKLGLEIIESDLRDTSKEDLEKHLAEAQLIHICGGSVFYLLSVLRKNNLDQLITNDVKSGKIMYSGTSAGSIVASGSTEIYKYHDEEAEHTHLLENNFAGLNLLDFVIIPHFNQEEAPKEYEKLIAHIPQFPSPIILLHDNQTVWVEDGNVRILSV